EFLGVVSGPPFPAGLLNLPTLVLVTVVTLLMNAGGIELESRDDVNLDRELRSVGIGNVLEGAGGGLPGFYALSLTVLSRRLGGSGWLVGLTASALGLGPPALGNFVLSLMPNFALRG